MHHGIVVGRSIGCFLRSYKDDAFRKSIQNRNIIKKF
jgi:hypothetical protein